MQKLKPFHQARVFVLTAAILATTPCNALNLSPIESQIARAYIANDCEWIRKNALHAKATVKSALKPIITAVVATCSPDSTFSEALFHQAEEQSPHDELILALHARHLEDLDPIAAQALWNKISVVATNPAIKRLARRNMDGGKASEKITPFESEWTAFGSFELSGSHEDNPSGQATSLGTRPPSYALNDALLGGLHRTWDSGNSLGVVASISNSFYFSAHDADFWENNLEIPYSIHVGKNEDLQLKPIVRYSQYSALSYESMGGLSFGGIAYRENYKQSVETILYQNYYYLDVMAPEGGTHFRFEYNWEYYFPKTYFRLMTYIEHVSAQEDTTLVLHGDIPYSNNNFGLGLYFDYPYRGLLFSLYPSVSFREDDNDSLYPNSSGVLITKRREDQTLDLKLKVAYPITPKLETIAYYEWNRTYSNMGASDYLDRNFANQIVGVGLRALLTSY